MLNFREELNKIKEEKLRSCEAQYEMVEVCLKGILDYLRKKRTLVSKERAARDGHFTVKINA